MPRAERNAPTLRIQRILEEFDAVEAYAQFLSDFICKVHPPEVVAKLPPYPRTDAVVEERMRQQMSGHKVRAAREHQRRVRAMGLGLTNNPTALRDIVDAVGASMKKELTHIHPNETGLSALPDGLDMGQGKAAKPEDLKKDIF